MEQYYLEHILPAKMQSDLQYIENRDPLKDIKIFLEGVFLLFITSIKWRYIFESKRRFYFLLLDMLISAGAYWCAFSIRFDGAIPDQDFNMFLKTLPFLLVLRIPSFVYFGLYQTLWQYLGIQELLAIIKAVTAGSVFLPLITFLLQLDSFPRSVVIVDWFLLVFALGASRIAYKITVERLRRPRFQDRKNVLILGAEDTGELLVREFIKQPELGYWPIGFLDDDLQKLGIRIHGVKVFGRLNKLSQVSKVKKIDEVVIALSHATSAEIRDIVDQCRHLRIPCRIIPQVSRVLSQRVLPLKLRDVDVSDLLGRELAHGDVEAIQNFIRGKRVLITGGGGSIGSELARLIHQMNPQSLILIDNVESNVYDIETELQNDPTETVVATYVRDVGNESDMREIFEKHRPHIVYHAAAYKHVPMMEVNYKQCILNNILGTKTVVNLSNDFAVETFVLISTDKAIRPKSIMGATKRICELYLQSQKNSQTRFLTVRFGNVFNSRGSVVPLFRKQLEEGLPLTVTDPNVKRYFMDISEAVLLILEASVLGSGPNVFMLDMGKSIKIVDLAYALAQLMGISNDRINIRFIGLRPGEKLEEELDADYERCQPTAHKKIKMLITDYEPSSSLHSEVEELIRMAKNGATRDQITDKIKQIVTEYQPSPQ